MKRKRKAKTTKWLFKGQFETEAKLILGSRSRNATHRFLNVALTFGVEHEPLGLLAG